MMVLLLVFLILRGIIGVGLGEVKWWFFFVVFVWVDENVLIVEEEVVEWSFLFV